MMGMLNSIIITLCYTCTMHMYMHVELQQCRRALRKHTQDRSYRMLQQRVKMCNVYKHPNEYTMCMQIFVSRAPDSSDAHL